MNALTTANFPIASDVVFAWITSSCAAGATMNDTASDFPLTVAVMVAEPVLSPVTVAANPVPVTVATVGSDDVHVTVGDASGLFAASTTLAVNVVVAPNALTLATRG
jgi:hypothetical protein